MVTKNAVPPYVTQTKIKSVLGQNRAEKEEWE